MIRGVCCACACIREMFEKCSFVHNWLAKQLAHVHACRLCVCMSYMLICTSDISNTSHWNHCKQVCELLEQHVFEHQAFTASGNCEVFCRSKTYERRRLALREREETDAMCRLQAAARRCHVQRSVIHHLYAYSSLCICVCVFKICVSIYNKAYIHIYYGTKHFSHAYMDVYKHVYTNISPIWAMLTLAHIPETYGTFFFCSRTVLAYAFAPVRGSVYVYVRVCVCIYIYIYIYIYISFCHFLTSEYSWDVWRACPQILSRSWAVCLCVHVRILCGYIYTYIHIYYETKNTNILAIFLLTHKAEIYGFSCRCRQASKQCQSTGASLISAACLRAHACGNIRYMCVCACMCARIYVCMCLTYIRALCLSPSYLQHLCRHMHLKIWFWWAHGMR